MSFSLPVLIGFLFTLVLPTLYAANVDPQQVHIALAGSDGRGNSNGMAVMYMTQDDTAETTIKYGLTSNEYTSTEKGSSKAYWKTFHHFVGIKDLKPATTYFYVVGDSQTNTWSKEFSFTSAPLAEDLRSFSFNVFADLGDAEKKHYGGPSIDYIGQHLKEDDVHLVWHGGDVGYADDSFLHFGCYTKFCYEEVFDSYMNIVQDSWAARVPYMVAVGNHEADCHSPACLLSKEKREKLSNFTAFNTRFHMPSVESNGTLNMHYSFNYGNVHFISIDSETGYPGAQEEKRYVMPCGGFGDQLAWLEADLIKANQNRNSQPWILVQGHRPMYTEKGINAKFQQAMESLFYTYGVDVYFSGHEHYYLRNYPVYQGVVDENKYDNPRFTTHVMIGGSGNDEMKDIQRKLSDEETQRKAFGIVDPSPGDSDLQIARNYADLLQDKYAKNEMVQAKDGDTPWLVQSDKDNHVGIGKVTILSDDELVFQYIRTKSNEVYDSFTLKRDHSISYPR